MKLKNMKLDKCSKGRTVNIRTVGLAEVKWCHEIEGVYEIGAGYLTYF